MEVIPATTTEVIKPHSDGYVQSHESLERFKAKNFFSVEIGRGVRVLVSTNKYIVAADVT